MLFGGELYAAAENNANGGALWKTSDGANWTQATPFGLGAEGSFSLSAAEALGELYVAAINILNGGQLWVQRSQPALGVPYCMSAPNSSGQAATISAAGDASQSSLGFCLTANGCPPDTRGIFFYGLQQTSLPFGNGVLCVGSRFHRAAGLARTDASGSATRYVDYALPLAGGIAAGGAGVHYQFWFLDLALGAFDVNLSDAVTIVHTP